ncbi:MAG TPA: strictosidine synthase, partial [Burkholderiaceae bacterium]
GLPGYPARMAAAEGGGFWLSVFACRTQLVEFVLGEDDYRREMMKTIEPRYWVAPALASGSDFLEPLQGGGVKQMGILKPWAPPRSYGLVIRIGADFIPKYSLHSRVGGRHHGVVSIVQRGDELYVLSKGAGRILQLSVSAANLGSTL